MPPSPVDSLHGDQQCLHPGSQDCAQVPSLGTCIACDSVGPQAPVPFQFVCVSASGMLFSNYLVTRPASVLWHLTPDPQQQRSTPRPWASLPACTAAPTSLTTGDPTQTGPIALGPWDVEGETEAEIC